MNHNERKIKNIHPGEVLYHEFIVPLGISPYNIAGLSAATVRGLCAGKVSISDDIASALSAQFGTSPEFWVSLQRAFDEEEKKDAPPLK